MKLPIRTLASAARLGDDGSGCLVKAADRGMLTAAMSLVQAAENEAARVRDEAREEARRIRERAQQEAAAEAADARARLTDEFLQKAAECTRGVRDDWRDLRTAFEAQASMLLSRALDRLLIEAPPQERIRASIRELIAEAGNADTAILCVHPDDRASVAAVAPELPWPLKPSADVAQGDLLLMSDRGEWQCSISGGSSRIAAVFE